VKEVRNVDQENKSLTDLVRAQNAGKMINWVLVITTIFVFLCVLVPALVLVVRGSERLSEILFGG
jgi:uncharacterized membrane protein YhaH (DUF805 family)